MARSFKSLLAAVVAFASVVVGVNQARVVAAPTASTSVPHYDHVFEIVEENHGLADVIGNPAAPNLNSLAHQFGLATDYFGVTHPSEPNYVALMGGNSFGIADDNAYWTHPINKPNLVTQLDAAHIGWKAYLQAVPHPGYEGICYPSKCNGTPDNDPLYVAKHDAIQNFTTALNPQDWSRQVPVDQLSGDLASGNVPAFSYVIPDECHDMHGDPPYCLDGGNPGDPQDQHLVTVGDDYLGHVVSSITNASFWAKGNNAISIVFDEGDDNAGCCDASPGGGKVANVVVTSHGPRNLQDPTPYNHYSLLQTIQQSLGVGCLEFTCDTTNVKPLAKLLAVQNTSAVATTPLPVPNFPTPSPTPNEPSSLTSKTPTAGGWSVVKSPLLGTNDNSLGAVAAASPDDVWAVGNFLPDTANSNQDATLNVADHFDGKSWTAVPTPNTGSNFNTLFGVAAQGGRAWSAGVSLDNQFRDRALIESWDGSQWSIANNPQPGSERDILFAVSALSPSDVWAVGDQQGPDGKFETLVEHWNGATWTVSPSSNPGTSGNHLYGVTAIGPDDVWAVGQQLGGGNPEQGLIEHWDGQKWSVVASPGHGSASTLLDSVASGADGLWAVGETDDAHQGGRPLIEQFNNGSWTDAALPPAGSNWTNLYGVTESQSATWAVGTFLDPASGNNQTLLLRRNGQGWSVVSGPNPGSGSNILGGIALAGTTLWSVGTYDDGGSRLTLIERH